ncbi:MAG: MAPEG family protein [Micropepsaceae bacterium]
MDFDAFVKSVKELPLPNLALTGLPVELSALALATVLGLLHLLIAARVGNNQRGIAWNVGARDAEPPKVSALAGRLERAYRNFMETFPFFAAAILIAHVTGRDSWMTILGSQMYLGARVIYWPLYAFGVPVVRTLVWLVSLIGILLVIAACFVVPVQVPVV